MHDVINHVPADMMIMDYYNFARVLVQSKLEKIYKISDKDKYIYRYILTY